MDATGHSLVHSFARTAYSFVRTVCSARLALLPHSTAPSFVCLLTHLLPWSLVNELLPVQVRIWGYRMAHVKAHRFLICLRHRIIECEKSESSQYYKFYNCFLVFFYYPICVSSYLFLAYFSILWPCLIKNHLQPFFILYGIEAKSFFLA